MIRNIDIHGFFQMGEGNASGGRVNGNGLYVFPVKGSGLYMVKVNA